MSASSGASWKAGESAGLSRLYKIKVPYETFKKWAEENKDRKEIKGFRPGKAPVSFFKDDWFLACARNMISEIKREEHLGDILDSGFSEEKFNMGEDIELTLHIELYPEIPEINFSEIEVSDYKIDVSKKDIDEALRNWAKSHSKPVELSSKRKSRLGDYLKVDIQVTAPDGGVESMKGVAVELGKGVFQPEIEKKLENCDIGEIIEHDFVIPENNGLIKDASLIGKTIKMSFTITEIKEPKNYEVDLEMAKLFDAPSIEILHEKFEKKLEDEAEEFAKFLAKEELKQALNKHYFEVPLNLLRTRYNQVREQTLKDLGFIEGKSNLTTLVKEKINLDLEEFDKRLIFISELAVRSSFLLGHLAKEFGLHISALELDEAISKQKANFPEGLKGAVRFYEENKEARENLTTNLLEEKVLKHLLFKCKLERKEVSLEDFYKNILGGVKDEEATETTKKIGSTSKKSEKSEKHEHKVSSVESKEKKSEKNSKSESAEKHLKSNEMKVEKSEKKEIKKSSTKDSEKEKSTKKKAE